MYRGSAPPRLGPPRSARLWAQPAPLSVRGCRGTGCSPRTTPLRGAGWFQAVALAALLSLIVEPTPAPAQEGCAPGPAEGPAPCVLGAPGQQAVTVRAAFEAPGQVRAFRFQVGRDGGTALLYVGDLWHEADVAL
jgi:hypothetical protein